MEKLRARDLKLRQGDNPMVACECVNMLGAVHGAAQSREARVGGTVDPAVVAVPRRALGPAVFVEVLVGDQLVADAARVQMICVFRGSGS